MEDSILESIKYFSFFNYPPTKEETYCFLKEKASFDHFTSILENKAKKGIIITKNNINYTLPEYSIKADQISKIKYQKYLQRQANSIKKLHNWRFKLYIKLISLFPQIKLVGLSGSISMLNAKENDDIDLFIITAKNRLFTARFIVVVICYLLGVKRRRGVEFSQDKICLNLFFDESNLEVSKYKQSEYVAHEVLQMKPIINKSQTYERFLQANLWVQKIFPNAIKSQITNQKSQMNNKSLKFKYLNLFGTWNLGFGISDKVEFLLKNLQLTLINRHKTNEIVTSTQLWFHPEDFEKKFESII